MSGATTTAETSPRVGFPEKLSYGVGDLACNLVFGAIGYYMLFFYTDIAGIAAATVGTLLLVCRIVEVFAITGMGVLVDRTRRRWGKARPWLLWIALPFGVGDANLMTLLMLFAVGPRLVGFLIMPPLLRRFGKRNTALYGTYVMILG